MKKLASTLPNMILSLGTITIVAGAILGATYAATKEPIAKQQQMQQEAAIASVAPKFDNNPEAEKWETDIDGQTYTVYPARENGKLVGAAVKGATMSGFAGEIVVMCGFEADGTVKDYRVLQQAETPGLGTKMEEWFRDPTGARSVIGKNPGTVDFHVTKDQGAIDGITAATISSRAFLGVMRHAYKAFLKYENNGNDAEESHESDGSTGASAKGH